MAGRRGKPSVVAGPLKPKVGMLDISSTRIKSLIVHRIGNKLREEGCQLSHKETSRSQAVDDLILRHYLASAARSGDLYEFYHESDIALNVIRHYCSIIFSDNDTFQNHSESIGKHLYSCSVHPNIVGGEFIVCLFDDIRVTQKRCQAIGLFRVEKKAHYLETKEQNGDIGVFECMGIPMDNIQKGAIVFSDNAKVHIVDTLSAKTKYWVDSFLKVIPSDESKICEKATATFLKSVSKRVNEPNQTLAFGTSLRKAVADNRGVSVADIVTLSEKYLGRDDVDAILNDIKVVAGRELPSALLVDEKRLKRIAREFFSKTEVCEGAHIVITKASLSVSGLEVEREGKSIRAVINMNLEEE